MPRETCSGASCNRAEDTVNIDYAIQSAFVHYNSGQLEDAERLCKKILKRQPKNAEVLNLLGLMLIQRKNYEPAIRYFEKSISADPLHAYAHNNLGFCLVRLGRKDEALGLFEKSIKIYPSLVEAWTNMGEVFFSQGLLDKAMESFQRAQQLKPNDANTWNNIGTCLLDTGRIRESMRYFREAIKINHHFPQAHFNLSVALLLLGDFENGWPEYMWRWGLEEFRVPDFKQPIWDKQDLTGKTLYLHAEQGFGDIFQFIRYAPLIAERGARVILAAPKTILPIMKTIQGLAKVVTDGDILPPFDIHCPLLCVPMAYGTNPDNIPAKVPYINADPLLVKKWAKKMEGDAAGLRVGLVWAGSTSHKKDHLRSCRLETYAPLVNIDGVTFYSLQKGAGSEQAKNPPNGMKLIDYMGEVIDFSDTAALIENLDLVISVDTSVAHLAGAMGKTVWTLIQYSPDWRWMLEREDSPWYPTMRLFRQPAFGDWDSVIEKVAHELRELRDSKDLLSVQEESRAEEVTTGAASQAAAVGVPAYVEDRTASDAHKENTAIILQCEGMGDCLFAAAVIRKLHLTRDTNSGFSLFTYNPQLFANCPYVDEVYDINDAKELAKFKKTMVLFDTSKLSHWTVDTFNFISFPLGLGELSFREKHLEYFPVEDDRSRHFDVVINTSVTWPSRSWPIENWQKVADYILGKGCSVAVVGKDTFSKIDNIWKRSHALRGCADLTNKLSLDQTYYAIRNADLFITCQNGLSVLSGATDTEIIVLDMSIEWSKRAIYRNEDPHYKVSYVKGNCATYCCSSFECPVYGEFRCIPTVEQVLDVVKRKVLSKVHDKK
jgi:Tfp pilus assembly protein PilF/ADP-heptose:LPS heptosyltransferase